MPDGTSCMMTQEIGSLQNNEKFCNSTGLYLPVFQSKKNATMVLSESISYLVRI